MTSRSQPFTIASVAKTLAEFKALPLADQAMLLLRRLAHIAPQEQSSGGLHKGNLLLPNDPYGLAAGFPANENTPVRKHLLGVPWTRLVNEGFLIDPSGSGFFSVSEDGLATVKNAAGRKVPVLAETADAHPADEIRVKKEIRLPTPSESFDEFLRKIDPLMQSAPLYRSLQFACVAARSGTEWILLFGNVSLSTEPCAAHAMIARVARVDKLLALKGRIKPSTVGNLITNLKNSWLITGMESENVRLSREGTDAYNWSNPSVFSADNAASQWPRRFAMNGQGSSPLELLNYSDWEEIDSQLRRSTQPFNGFDGLCGNLGLNARRANLTYRSLELLAELPARFAKIQTHPTKGTLEVAVECIGSPDLMVDWLPQYDFKRLPLALKSESGITHHDVSLAVPTGATRANVILSFAELEAENQTVSVVRNASKVAAAAQKSAQTGHAERWKLTGRTLGEGGQAQVFVVEDTQKEQKGQWALKRLKNIRDQKAKARFRQEVVAIQLINHRNILRIIDSNLDAERPYFVAEYCERGSLETIGGPRFKGDIVTTAKLVLPILEALVATHTAGVIHRDIKPSNILIRGDDTPVIGDFGICFVEGEQRITFANEGVGSRNFIAPEMESGHHDLGESSDRTDVYSLGKVIYWMLSGGNEFAREDYPSLVTLLKDQRFEHVNRLLEQMVVREPAARIQSHEVKEKLEMAFSLVEGNFAPLAPSIGIRCRFCGVGSYERASIFEGKHMLSHLGLAAAEQSVAKPPGETALLRCAHCGHIEFFQLKGIACEGWWGR